MNLLHVEQLMLPLLPLWFLGRYLIKVRPKRRMIESWWLIGSNAAFALILLLGAVTLILGQSWPARTSVREAIYAVTICVFAAEVAWLEYRLSRGTAQIPPDDADHPQETRADKTIHRETA